MTNSDSPWGRLSGSLDQLQDRLEEVATRFDSAKDRLRSYEQRMEDSSMFEFVVFIIEFFSWEASRPRHRIDRFVALEQARGILSRDYPAGYDAAALDFQNADSIYRKRILDIISQALERSESESITAAWAVSNIPTDWSIRIRIANELKSSESHEWPPGLSSMPVEQLAFHLEAIIFAHYRAHKRVFQLLGSPGLR